MVEKTPDVVEQTARYTPDLFIIPSAVMLDKSLQSLDAKVYAVVYWFERMKDGYCRASNDTIAKIAGSSSSGVANSLVRLREAGHIECTYDNDNHRLSIVTLTRMSKGGYSVEEGGGYSNEEHIQKKNIEEKKYTSDELSTIDELHRLFVLRFFVDPHIRQYGSDGEKRLAFSKAIGRHRLTTKRKEAIVRRLRDSGVEDCKKAIVNCSKSDFHRGMNDNKWSASIEWLFKSQEKIEEWANKGDV